MTDNAANTINRLEVSRAAFVEELRRMTRLLGRRNAGEALFIFDVGRLLLRVGGAEFAVPANGHWAGEARASTSLLHALAKVPPARDPVVIEIRSGRLCIAGSSVPCRWQPPGLAVIEVPLDLDLRGRLELGLAHPQEVLENSGIAPLITDARAEMNRCIAAAARQLAPLGITSADLRALVAARLTPQGRA